MRDPLAPGAAIVCLTPTETGAAEPEIRVVYAMNHKLRHYPEFASAIGIDLVSDCESADRFLRGYGEYLQEHPGFDLEQPLGETPEGELVTIEDEVELPEVSKIYNGTEAINNPVVELMFPADPPNQHSSWGPPKDVSFCTGTFINKNWILTAAHCLSTFAVYRCKKQGTSVDACNPAWEVRGAVRIRGTKTATHEPFAFVVPARAYTHGSWIGRIRATNPELCGNCYPALSGAAADLALLYIHPGDADDKLPPIVEDPDPPTSLASIDAAMRLSIVEPEANWPLRYFGYGETNGGVSGILKSATMTFSTQPNSDVIEGTVPTIDTPFPCIGDSGGPLVRTGLDLITNFGRKQGIQAIVAVTSAGSNTVCDAPLNIPSHSYRWTRIDRGPNRQFIKDTLKRWPIHRRLACTKRPLLPVAGSRVQVEECWGKPCADHDDCGENEFCSSSFRDFESQSSCEACDGTPEQGTCNCIVGQCVPER